jgi:uncharacterized protein YuzE
MKIKYDEKIDAKYVYIKKGKIVHTKKKEDWLLFDCAKNGDVLGIEILNASKHPMSIYTIRGELFGYSSIKFVVGSDAESLVTTIKSSEFKKENQFTLA